MDTVVRHLRRVALRARNERLTDGQLLGAFLARRDEEAFEALVRRFGPLVLGVCRRVLRNDADAEDAFQATFVILFRRASTVRAREKVGSWLYGVAYRTAMKARAMSAKRAGKEKQAAGVERAGDGPDPAERELLRHLDAEVGRLGDKYREVLVLCDLEGKTQREAARALGVPAGTVSSRLARARQMLARRMAKYGPALPAAAPGLVLTGPASAGVPAPLVVTTVRAATGAMSAPVAALVQGVLKTMLLMKLKLVSLAAALTLSVCAVAFAQQSTPPAKATQVAADDLEALRLEIQALRLEVKATRERVKGLEEVVKALPRQTPGMAPPPAPRPASGALPAAKKQSAASDPGAGVYLHLAPGAGKPGGASEPNPPKWAEQLKPLFAAPPSGKATWAAPNAPGQAAALAQAEAALKKLREAPDDVQAIQALEQALQQLRSRKAPAHDQSKR